MVIFGHFRPNFARFWGVKIRPNFGNFPRKFRGYFFLESGAVSDE